MALSEKAFVLLLTILASAIMPTEYSVAKPVKEREACKQKFEDCGEFHRPEPAIGNYVCLNKTNCEIHCKLRCPTENGIISSISKNNNGDKETYVCSGRSWRLKDIKLVCVAKNPVPIVLQNFHHVDKVNDLIEVLLNSSYYYLTMASFYERADVALPGFSHLMTELWESEVKHTKDLMSYINRRGGHVVLPNIARPQHQNKLIITSEPGLTGLEMALDVTHAVQKQALTLHKAASSKKFPDPHLKYYLEDGIISQKIDTIKKLADRIKQLKSFSSDDYVFGEYVMDLEIDGVQA